MEGREGLSRPIHVRDEGGKRELWFLSSHVAFDLTGKGKKERKKERRAARTRLGLILLYPFYVSERGKDDRRSIQLESRSNSMTPLTWISEKKKEREKRERTIIQDVGLLASRQGVEAG